MSSSNHDQYSDKLGHSSWQKKKTEILIRDDHTCQSCFIDRGFSLHIHHKKYLPNKEPWDYPNSNFITLCEVCHNTEHLLGQSLNMETLIGVIRGNNLMVCMISQLCVLAEEDEKFESELRWFLKKQIDEYYSRRNEKRSNAK